MTHIEMSCNTHINEPCLTHIEMSHDTHRNEPCLTHIQTSNDTNRTCLTHVEMSHDIPRHTIDLGMLICICLYIYVWIDMYMVKKYVSRQKHITNIIYRVKKHGEGSRYLSRCWQVARKKRECECVRCMPSSINFWQVETFHMRDKSNNRIYVG